MLFSIVKAGLTEQFSFLVLDMLLWACIFSFLGLFSYSGFYLAEDRSKGISAFLQSGSKMVCTFPCDWDLQLFVFNVHSPYIGLCFTFEFCVVIVHIPTFFCEWNIGVILSISDFGSKLTIEQLSIMYLVVQYN